MVPNNGSGLVAPELVLTENSRKVLEARYLKKNEAGECVERPEQLFRRVARAIADPESGLYGGTEADRRQWEDRFYELMTRGAFMPNSPTLMNAGREMGMLSACFVLPVRDSISDIFDSIKHTALIQKAGGGTGFAFDELRPTGDFISSSGGTTSGPISFWRAFSEATNAIQQGAFRRGANMGMMYVHHPDILKFLHAKQDLSQFTNYNISVKVTDAWMEDFLADPDAPHVVRNPRTGQAFLLPRGLDIWKYDVRSLIEIEAVAPPADVGERYYASPRLTADLPEPLRGKVYTKRDIWNIIIQNAWETGEPGVVFIDRINEANPTPHVGRMEATNPCGEQPLLPYEACNLGSLNLGLFIEEPCTPRARVDWDGLREAIHQSTRFLDNVIDANNYPLPEIDAVCKANRKIGLGIMGFADALYRLNLPYNSEEGVAWGERFMKFVNDEAHNYSEQLARERGSFPNWKGSIWDTLHQRPMRNACTTTVAPTGTISIIANCSGGIEPMFSLAFMRNVLRGQKQGEKPLVEVNDTFREVARQHGLLCDELLERLAREGTLAHIDEVKVGDRVVAIPDDLKRIFVCAHDITPLWHMRMQAAFQRHCDSSISKTINFPQAATSDDVEQIYRLAFELRCKGVTVYRDGCRGFQPMALKKEDGERAKSEQPNEQAAAREPAVGANGSAQPARTGDAKTLDGEESSAAEEVRAARGADAALPQRGAERAPDPLSSSLAALRSPIHIEPLDLPEILSSFRMRQMTPFGNMHVHITVEPQAARELEVFAQLGKGGDVANSDLEAICRLISLWLRSGGSLRHVIKQLEGIGSSLQIPTKSGRIMSLGDGVASALKKYVRAKETFGLHALLLGQIDLAILDDPNRGLAFPGGGSAGAAANDRDGRASGGNSPGGLPGSGVRAATTASIPHANRPARSSAPRANGGAAAAGGATPRRAGAAPMPHAAGSNGPSPHDASGNGGSAMVNHATGGGGCGSARGQARASGTRSHASAVRPTVVGEVGQAGSGQTTEYLTDAGAVVPGYPTDAAAAVAECSTDTAVAVLDPNDQIPAALDRDEAAAVGLDRDEPTAGMMTGRAAADSAAADDSAAGLFLEMESHDVLEVTATDSGVRIREVHDVAQHYRLACPECAGPLALQEGCRTCHACGWSAC
jgi:ribonucleoside-diphosphate reductase alpha chain